MVSINLLSSSAFLLGFWKALEQQLWHILGFHFLLNNNNIAWSFVGKYEQVSTYVSWKIPLYQSYN